MQATRKVIIADESREFAVPCASLLKSFGVEAILVPKDGEALYEAIVAQKPQAVLCDVFMPHSDAIGVMKRVREEDDLPQPQFMVLSGFDNVMLQNEVMQSGARYYFLKPFDPEVLAERIVQLLGSASEENGKNIKTIPLGAGGQDMELMVTEMIHQIGVPAHIKGYHYLREAILLSVEDPEVMNAVTKVLYPTVAKKFGTPLHGWSGPSATLSKWHGIEGMWIRSTPILAIPSTIPVESPQTANLSPCSAISSA